MRQLVLVIVSCVFSYSAFAQKIHFTDSTNKWRWVDYSCGGDPGTGSINIDSFYGDTIIAGLHYKVCSEYGATFIREDTLLKKVFAIAPHIAYGSSTAVYYDTSEQLLYDYSLNIGDTFKCHLGAHVLSTIDSTQVNGIWHKIWRFTPVSPALYPLEPYYVIEGVGSVAEPLFPLYPWSFESCMALTCFWQNDVRPSVSPAVDYYFDNDFSCSLTFGVMVSNQRQNEEVSIYPNPSNGRIYIESAQQQQQDPHITIYDALGRKVYTTANLPSSGYLDLQLPDGIYTLRYCTNDYFIMKKVVINH